MTAKYLRIAAMAGALAIAVGALAACNDSSTASAPIGGESVIPTSLSGSDSSKASGEAEASKQAADGASRASVSHPATAPDTKTTPPANYPGPKDPPPAGVKLTDKQKSYLASLKKQNVEFMGDTDGNVALTMGAYVCDSEANKVDPTIMKAYVRAAIGSMSKTDAEANSKADKIVVAAEKHLC